jgi:hypothetical protein
MVDKVVTNLRGLFLERVLRVVPVPSTNLPQCGAVIQKLVVVYLVRDFCRSQRFIIVSTRVRRWMRGTPSITVCIAVSVGVGSDGIYDDEGSVKVNSP